MTSKRNSKKNLAEQSVTKFTCLVAAFFLCILSPDLAEAKFDLSSKIPTPLEKESIVVLSQEFSSDSQKENLEKISSYFEAAGIQDVFSNLLREMEDCKAASFLKKSLSLIYQKNFFIAMYYPDLVAQLKSDLDPTEIKALITIDLDGDFSDFGSLFALASEMQGFKKDSDNVFSFGDVFFLREGSLLYISSNRDFLIKSKDLEESDSLKNMKEFKERTTQNVEDYFAWVFSAARSTVNTTESYVAFFKAQEDSISTKTQGSSGESLVKNLGLTLPSLESFNKKAFFLDKIPSGEPVYYLEIKNLKFFIELAIKFFEKEANVNLSEKEEYQYLEENILPLLEKDLSLVFEFNEAYPSLTLLDNVSGNSKLAQANLEKLDEALHNLSQGTFGPSMERSLKDFKGGEFVSYAIEIPREVEGLSYNIDKAVISFGVTSDEIAIISTHLDFFEEYAKSKIDPDLSSDRKLNSIFYFNPNPLFDFTDKFIDKMDIEGVRYYLGIRNTSSIIKNTSSLSEIKEGFSHFSESTLNFQNPTKLSFKDWLQEQKIKDDDNDGITNFEERVLFKTDFKKEDTDDDGLVDGIEVNQKRDPLKFESKFYFEDVAINHSAKRCIMALETRGVTNGFGEGKTFEPDRDAKRGETLVLAIRSFADSLYLDYYKEYAVNGFTDFMTGDKYQAFSDVTEDDFYSSYLGYLYYNKRIKGIKRGEELVFLAGDNVSRATALAIIFAAADIEAPAAKESFKDVGKDKWYFDISALAKEKFIITGEEFNGEEIVNRAQVSEMICNTILNKFN